jgi:hypothetical protein
MCNNPTFFCFQGNLERKSLRGKTVTTVFQTNFCKVTVPESELSKLAFIDVKLSKTPHFSPPYYGGIK